jgi:hypothetical protein
MLTTRSFPQRKNPADHTTDKTILLHIHPDSARCTPRIRRPALPRSSPQENGSTIPCNRLNVLFTMSNSTQGPFPPKGKRDPQTRIRLGHGRTPSASKRSPPPIRSRPPRPHGHDQNGGARRDRTDDLMLAKHALSQLSYGPQGPARRQAPAQAVVGLGRLELPTSRLSSARSNQLSYKPATGQRPAHRPRPASARTPRPEPPAGLSEMKEKRRRRHSADEARQARPLLFQVIRDRSGTRPSR